MSVFSFRDLAFMGVVLTPAIAGFDVDASFYILAVEAADGQQLESGVRDAINAFVVGCKADGIWNAIKASCILAGARTLTGALVPLVGAAPTNNNFVSGDYNRKTGLVGNGSTKYLSSNRANNADPQNSFHMSCHLSTAATGTVVYMGAGPATNENGASNIGKTASVIFSRNRLTSVADSTVTGASPTATGFVGNNRSASSSFVTRVSGSNITLTRASTTPDSNVIGVFASTNGAFPANARLAFYSIGEALDLALLNARVTTLVNAIAAAIP